MAPNVGRRFQGTTTLEKAVYTVLLLVLVVDIGLIVFARADDDPAPAPPGAAAAATGETTATAEPAPETSGQTSVSGDEPPPCAEVEDPGRDGDPVTCRTQTARLTIAGEDRPLVLGATQVRLFDSSLQGQQLTTRLRIRNETEAEQGVLAGGQEIYLNLGGLRVDADPVGDVRIPAAEATNTRLRFSLTPARVARLRNSGGRAELGVRPWDEGAGGAPGTVVGVIRFRVPLGA